MNSKLMQTLNHVPFTFQKRISGAEDAQNQRHRGTLASRPVLQAHLRREPDVIMPWAIARNPQALAEYDATIRALWDAKNTLLDRGAPPEAALYLLPNSHRIRFYESGTLLDLLLEVGQAALLRRAAGDLRDGGRGGRPGARGLPDDRTLCRWSALRDARSRPGRAPICPEGERFCGIPVWRNYQFEKLEERRVL